MQKEIYLRLLSQACSSHPIYTEFNQILFLMNGNTAAFQSVGKTFVSHTFYNLLHPRRDDIRDVPIGCPRRMPWFYFGI